MVGVMPSNVSAKKDPSTNGDTQPEADTEQEQPDPNKAGSVTFICGPNLKARLDALVGPRYPSQGHAIVVLLSKGITADGDLTDDESARYKLAQELRADGLTG